MVKTPGNNILNGSGRDTVRLILTKDFKDQIAGTSAGVKQGVWDGSREIVKYSLMQSTRPFLDKSYIRI
jgi:hypothetical protein